MFLFYQLIFVVSICILKNTIEIPQKLWVKWLNIVFTFLYNYIISSLFSQSETKIIGVVCIIFVENAQESMT